MKIDLIVSLDVSCPGFDQSEAHQALVGSLAETNVKSALEMHKGIYPLHTAAMTITIKSVKAPKNVSTARTGKKEVT